MRNPLNCRSACLLAAIAVFLAPITGCGGGDDNPNKMPTVPTKIKITANGNALEGLQVILNPIKKNDKEKVYGAVGTTDSEGVAVMHTLGHSPASGGAIEGNYIVTVKEKPAKVDASGGGSDFPEDDPNYQPPEEGKTQGPKVTAPRFNMKYTNRLQSPLKCTVSKDKETHTFEIQ